MNFTIGITPLLFYHCKINKNSVAYKDYAINFFKILCQQSYSSLFLYQRLIIF